MQDRYTGDVEILAARAIAAFVIRMEPENIKIVNWYLASDTGNPGM